MCRSLFAAYQGLPASFIVLKHFLMNVSQYYLDVRNCKINTFSPTAQAFQPHFYPPPIFNILPRVMFFYTAVKFLYTSKPERK